MVTPDNKALGLVIECVYEAAANPVRWRDVAPVAARAFAAESAALQIRTLRPAMAQLLSTTPSFSPRALEALAACGQRLGAHDAIPFAIRHGINLAEDGSDAAEATTYDQPVDGGIFHLLGGFFPTRGDGFGILAVHRRRGPAFTDSDRSQLRSLLPHFKHGLTDCAQIPPAEPQRVVSLEIFERIAAAVLIVAASGQVHFANSAAQALQRSGEGIQLDDGRLSTVDPGLSPELDRLILHAALAGPGRALEAGGALRLPRADNTPLRLVVVPLGSRQMDLGLREPAVLILITDPAVRREPAATTLAGLYGLTPGQAGLIAALLDGQHIGDHAETKRLAHAASRSHLRQLLQERESNAPRELSADAISRLAAEL